MSFQDFFTESMDNEVEVDKENEFDEKEIELGMEDEAVHIELYNKFKAWAEENELEMPMTQEDFLMDIVTTHLKDNPTEYSDALECKEETTEEVEEATSPEAIKLVNSWKKKRK